MWNLEKNFLCVQIIEMRSSKLVVQSGFIESMIPPEYQQNPTEKLFQLIQYIAELLFSY